MIDLKTRLNTEIRDSIVSRALETSGLIAEEKQLIEDRAAFAEKVRLICVAKENTSDKELSKFYESVHSACSNNKYSSFFSLSVGYRAGSSNYFQVGINGQTHELYLDGSVNRYEETHVKIADIQDGGPFVPLRKVLLSDNALLDEINLLEKRNSELKDKREKVSASVRAAVSKVGTVKSLVEQWPEVVDLLPDSYKKSQSLALNPTELNAICGIPK